MGKDQSRLLPPHLDLHLEVFVPKKKKEIAENVIVNSRNLKSQNPRTSSLPKPASKNLWVSQKTRKFSRQLFDLFEIT
jgi:hypothetical protein